MISVVIVMAALLTGCDSHDSQSRSGGDAVSGGRAPIVEQAESASNCISLLADSQTFNNGSPVSETHNFSITNNCRFDINALLYSGGHVGEGVYALSSGASILSEFSIATGQPRGFACRAPLQPQVSVSKGVSKRCL